MPYIQKKFFMKSTIEVEKVYSGRWNRGGERSDNRKATPEDVARVNERNAIKKLRRKINTNFSADDFHVTLTYRRENRLEPEEARKAVRRFLAGLKRDYRKLDKPLKYIVVTEYKNKAIHHHMIINNVEGCQKMIRKRWEHGRPYFVPLDEEGDYGQLAEYLIKETGKTFREESRLGKQRYSCSRNLEEPKVEVKVMKAKEWREDPKPPKGYYIDKSTFYDGFHEVTGRRCQYYTCVKMKEPERRKAKKAVEKEWPFT